VGKTVRVRDGGFWLVVGMAVVLVALVLAMVAKTVMEPAATGLGAPGAPGDVASFLSATPREAPPIELTDPDAEPFSLASLRGEPVFVFFGYTHCPDVCPATTGALGLTMDAYGPGVNAVFVSVDPERDTSTWLKEYVRFLPTGFVALTGTEEEIRATADAWGARYARVETGVVDAYSMSHTAEVYLLDANGTLRAEFPFGTAPEVMEAVLRQVVSTPLLPVVTPAPPLASAAPGDSGAAVAAIDVKVISTSVWSGPPGPVILTLSTGETPLDDYALHPTVQLERTTGEAVGDAVVATPVRPPGVETVSYVANLAIPTPGDWQIKVWTTRSGTPLAGSVALTVLDPGSTTPIGAAAPRARTPTLADVGGNIRAVTTDPAPDVRLSERSTVDLLDAHEPFVLVIDSSKFRTSPACGRAIILARYMLDRWPDVGWIHLEPYPYAVVSETAVLNGTLENPSLTEPAAAWGFGEAPWGARTMPWVFVVDGQGIIRAKYQGIFGSADVDVIVTLIKQGG
jgi:protein SCO1